MQSVCLCACVFLPTHYAMNHFEGVTLATERIPWWWRPWRAETCSRLTDVWRVYILVHVKFLYKLIRLTFYLQYKNVYTNTAGHPFTWHKPDKMHKADKTPVNPAKHKINQIQIYIYIYIYIHTGCPGRNVPDFGRMFLKLKHTDITQNTYIQSWTVTGTCTW